MTTRAGCRARVPGGQMWIQVATTASVIVLALIAAVVSYGHMHTLALRHGEGQWASALIPLSVDGMIVAASMALLLDSRLGRKGGRLPWALLIVGALASVTANVAVAEPTITGRVIAAWPSFALTCSYELLMRQVRQLGPVRNDNPKQSRTGKQRQPRRTREHQRPASVPPAAVPAGATVNGSADSPRADRSLQRKAWQWALAHRRPDGSLPSGGEVARQFQRSPRWGRLVKNTGLEGQL
ncbi:MAG: DUF2637 domain-containing protein [Streptosporangiaceae bacterium]